MSDPQMSCDPIRHDWRLAEVQALFALPFTDLILRAQRLHRAHHEPNTVQMSTLLSIKTGACPEDCAYCPQSVRYDTGLATEALLEVAAVREHAVRAKAAGATRFCMGAAYRSPKARDLQVIVQMVREVRALGLESCATLGMLTPAQATELKAAGLIGPRPDFTLSEASALPPAAEEADDEDADDADERENEPGEAEPVAEEGDERTTPER